MLKFSKLHYERNWFTAIFSVMKRVIQDVHSGQPVLSIKQTWKNGIQVFSDPQFGNLMLEGKFIMKAAFEWDLYEVGKAEPFARMKSHVFRTILALGMECASVETLDGKPFITVDREAAGIAKHVLDNMTVLYNPTHVYTLKKASGGKLGELKIKHGIWKAYYDLELGEGTEKECAACLLLYGYFLLMPRK
jgi:hypothetical protein